MKSRRIFFSIVFLIILEYSAFAESEKKGFSDFLREGQNVSGIVRISQEKGSYISYRIRVPDHAYGIRISLEDAMEDLDLFASFGREINDYKYVDALSESDSGREVLLITRLSDPPLFSGDYYIDVAYRLNDPPVIDGRPVAEIPFTIKYEIIDYSIEKLESGTPVDFVLRPEEGMLRRFVVTVPKNTHAMRVDVLKSSGDIDFMAGYRNSILTRDNCDYLKNSYLSKEHLIVSGADLPPGNYYFTFMEQLSTPYPVDVKVLVSFSEEAPADQKVSLPDNESLNPAARAMAATVEVISESSRGSGCIISEDGYILTNYHVIEKMDGKAGGRVWIAMNENLWSPPVELFVAEVIRSDRDLDLALLKINGTFYGRKLPQKYSFPYYSMGDDKKLGLGDQLYIIGFPGIGGTGARVTVSMTRGIVSGFEKRGDGFVIKTDSTINYGNSGGAATDKDYNLIGLPTMIIGEGSGQMGFIHPLNLFPEEWLSLIKRTGQ